MSGTVSRAATFLGSLGVDTHIAYTDGGYANIANVGADLAYLGITYVRDGISNGVNGSAPLSSYIALAEQGIKFTMIVGGGGNITTAALNSTLALIGELNTAVPGSVIAVEGVNEINNSLTEYNGVGGITGAVALQKDLYAAVHASPALSGVAVDYFTGYDAGNVPVGPDPATTPGLADYDTQHPYPQNGAAPAAWVAPAQTLPNEAGGIGPAVYTETGYSTNLALQGAVNEDVQAKYSLDLLMDTFKDGISQTYLYQVMDAYQQGSPQGDDGFGLFDTSNAPKEAATAIHDLTTILADKGANAASFTTGNLNYSLNGMPSTGNSELLEKSDGTFDLVLWAEPQIWNAATQTEITAPASAVGVSLGATYASVSVFDPLLGTSPIATYTNVSQIAVSPTDHPLIIQVGPTVVATTTAAAPPTTPVTATPTTITLGSGSQTIALAMSEDAYQGNAQFTVSVDGVQVGGTQSLTALHSAGQTQTVNVEGNWAAGTHTVTVDFLNDIFGGSATTDRNVYVAGATLNGTAVSGSALTMLSGGAQSFSVAIPAATTTTTPPASTTSSTTTTGTSTSGTSTSTTTTPSTITLGSGSQTIALAMSEDAYQGNAQFTVSVDGVQIGGTQSLTALHSAGQSQTVDVEGNWAAGAHTVTVDFLNDLYGGSSDTDRNIYVAGATLNGTAITGSALTMLSGGAQSFTATVPTATTTTTASSGTSSTSTSTTTPSTGTTASTGSGSTPSTGTVTLGSGPDTLALQMSEDAYQGDAQFTISVNGTQIGGVQTASASHAAGQSQTFDILGNFSGANTVSIDFLNDLYGGTATTDRNLYETGATINGQTINGSALTEMGGGAMSFAFKGTTDSTSTASSPVVLNLAEDAFQGNAQFIYAIDGGTASAPQTVTALNASGQSQAFSLGDLSAGSHQISVSFINDLYDGTADTDRNLYVTGIDVGGTPAANTTASILGDWTTNFTVTVPSHS